jgi:hypothetical protein
MTPLQTRIRNDQITSYVFDVVRAEVPKLKLMTFLKEKMILLSP